jgi:hypothetical protein
MLSVVEGCERLLFLDGSRMMRVLLDCNGPHLNLMRGGGIKQRPEVRGPNFPLDGGCKKRSFT